MQLYEYFGYFTKTTDQKMVFDETGKVGVWKELTERVEKLDNLGRVEWLGTIGK